MPGIKLYVMEWQLPTSTSGNCWSDKVRLKDLQAVDRSRDLVLVGHLISGPVLQTMYASSPGGYAVRISQHHDTFKVASTIEGFPYNIRILTHLLRTK
ncbi:MAG: hypothetical protein J3Q66DRAFT_397870 [Benniella sp.]|nr:MAG: hypothetical protein J3Q66DRAFT_397870 [Benniella sp.]